MRYESVPGSTYFQPCAVRCNSYGDPIGTQPTMIMNYESALGSVYAQPCAVRCMLSEYPSPILSYSMNLECSQMLALYREPIGILPALPMRYESVLGSTYFQPCTVRCMLFVIPSCHTV
jgi:hypothetical protein